MDREIELKQDNIKLNKLVAKSLRITLSILVVIWIMGVCGVFSVEQAALTLCVACCGFFMLIPTLLIDVLHINKDWIPYMVVSCTITIVGLLTMFLSYHASALILFPLMIASLYSSTRLVIYTTIANCVMVVFTSIGSAYFSFSVENAYSLNWKSALLYMGLPNIFIVIVMSFISYFIVSRNNKMLNNAIERSLELNESQRQLIFAFAEISENKSKYTGEHIKRVAAYMRVLGNASGFTKEYVDKLCTASMMHDIGKLMIPEEILDKPDKLTHEEYAIMRNHVLYGEALLHDVKGDIMNIARIIALQHHEKWDGTGYLQMKGEDIAYIARMMALADVFDALTSKRYYKEGWSAEDTYNEIVKLSGTHFDPDVVQLFIDHFDEFKEILISIPDKQIY